MRRCVFNNIHPVNLFLLRPTAAAAIWDLKRAYLKGAVAKRRRLFAFGTIFCSLFCFPRAILWLIPIAIENGRQSSVGAVAPTKLCWKFEVRCLPMNYRADARLWNTSRQKHGNRSNHFEIQRKFRAQNNSYRQFARTLSLKAFRWNVRDFFSFQIATRGAKVWKRKAKKRSHIRTESLSVGKQSPLLAENST